MADKTTGGLKAADAVSIEDLPGIIDLYDETLIPVEQQGEARHMTGRQWRNYAEVGVSVSVEEAKAAAEAAKASKTAAETAAGTATTNAAKAEGSASEAKEAAAGAEEARKSIADMTVASESLSPSETATVTKTIQNGVFHLKFGLPKGDPGADGTSFVVLGRYDTLEELEEKHPTGTAGDAWAVGTPEDNEIYLWDVDGLEWKSVGSLQGPPGTPGQPGQPGEPGPPGEPGKDGVGIPDGGTAGQMLAKASAADQDVEWRDPPEGVGRSMAGQTVEPTQGTTVTASNGAEIFNDYRARTYGTDEGSTTIVAQTGNIASGTRAHAEGSATTANGTNSHAEGFGTIASGSASHAEGGGFTGKESSKATAYAAHAEGTSTTASGNSAHSEGQGTTASNVSAHAEGKNTSATGQNSHAEGYAGIAEGSASHVEGGQITNKAVNKASGYAAHAEGASTLASGSESHAEGEQTTASGIDSHAQGYLTTASASYAHSEGYKTTASAPASHAEGNGTMAKGDWGTHAEGQNTQASGYYSHSEGGSTIASGNYSHAEGLNTTASSHSAHAEGENTTASGIHSHAEGYETVASGFASYAGGSKTIASDLDQVAIGRLNVEKKSDGSMFIIGNGTDNIGRSNCFRVDQDGRVFACSPWGQYNASGADYAELFEWADGNPEAKDRAGRFVTLEGKNIRLAGPQDDYILGIVSGNPSVVGDVHDDQWQGMYLTDVFGRPIWEDVEVPAVTEQVEIPVMVPGEGDESPRMETRTETQVIIPAHTERRQKLNPNYDPTQPYIPRSKRPEWDAVGMLGKLVVVDDGSCREDGWATVGKGGIAVGSEERTRYRVMERLDGNHVRILIL